MLHTKRTWREPTTIDSAEDLATLLSEFAQNECAAFQLVDLLFLNDSTSPNGAQEYAVLRNGEQIESITMGWCTPSKAQQYITEMLNGTRQSNLSSYTPIFHPATDYCRYCR